MNGPYHVAKFGIEAMGDVFRQELRPWGISVSIVEPGSIATPIWERVDREAEAMIERVPDTEKLYGKQLEAVRRLSRKLGERGIPPERVASTIEQGADRAPPSRPLPGRRRREGPGAAEDRHPDSSHGTGSSAALSGPERLARMIVFRRVARGEAPRTRHLY